MKLVKTAKSQLLHTALRITVPVVDIFPLIIGTGNKKAHFCVRIIQKTKVCRNDPMLQERPLVPEDSVNLQHIADGCVWFSHFLGADIF